MQPKQTFCVVLVNTSHPGNIGACARAMKNMGITDLRLVNTVSAENEVAYNRSSGAQDVLFHAKQYQNLNEAVADCHYVWGTSARKRTGIATEILNARDIPETVKQYKEAYHIALVFGNEQNGLSNDELACCHKQIIVPTNPQFSSLNIAACAQLITFQVSAFQAQTDSLANTSSKTETSLASQAQLNALTNSIEQLAFNKNPQRQASDSHKLKSLFFKLALSGDEVDFLHGMIKRMQNNHRGQAKHQKENK